MMKFDKFLIVCMNEAKISFFILLVVVSVITCIHPIYPNDQYLQHIGTLFLMIPLVVDLKINRMPQGAFVGLVLFTLFHVIGARYIYSYVPYREWLVSIGMFGSDFFQDSRNNYDRFVHFAFGVLLFPYILYLCKSVFHQKPLTAMLMTWLIIQTGSMIYELFEWALTVFMSPDDADSYNGHHGDIWDAQKDMALAMLGSTIVVVVYFFDYKLRRKA